MKLRNRLTLISTLVFGVVFTIAAILVYLTFGKSSENIIFNELEKTGRLAAIFYLEEDELSQKEHAAIETQFFENLQGAEIRVFNEDNIIIHGDREPDQNITSTLLNQARLHNKVNFKAGALYYCGFFYSDNEGDFVVFIRENNELFLIQSQRLLFILAIVLLAGLLAIYLLSRALSKIAYRPVSDVIQQVNEIEPESLDKPIKSPGTNDELQDLVDTFNNLLIRLSESFIIQKNFINYVSHELKTPLASIAGNLEVFAQRDRSPQEYQEVAQTVVSSVYNMEEVINNLMLISGLRDDEKSKLKNIRIDEIAWDIIQKLPISNAAEKVSLLINVPADKAEALTFKGNEIQLKMALFNLLENAVKYSDGKPVEVILDEKEGKLLFSIKDKGKGISESELEFINQPFFRGSNVKDIKGTGIGVPLASIIFKKSNIQFRISSELQKGTTVEVEFPKR
jgi:two-component system, OmpR family, sensor histidine kinase ArlS